MATPSELANPKADPASDQITSLPHGERWFHDGFSAIHPAGGIVSQLCDMTQASAAVQALRERGLRATYTHVIVRAAALAMRRYPEAHQLVCGYTRIRPASVDIGLSVAGKTNYAPVLVIPAADQRPLPALVEHLLQAVPAAREKEERDLAGMMRTGWIIPFGAVRRWILRMLGRSYWFRRRLVGTFQVTCLPGADIVTPMNFYSSILLAVGGTREHVLAVNGKPEVRLAAWLCVPFDHRAMDGLVATNLMNTVRKILESRELVEEACAPPTDDAAAALAPKTDAETELPAKELLLTSGSEAPSDRSLTPLR